MAKPTFAVVYNPCSGFGTGPEQREVHANQHAALARADALLRNPGAVAPAVRVAGMPVSDIANLRVERIELLRTYTATIR